MKIVLALFLATATFRPAIDAIVQPLMARDHIPGMAVAIADGSRTYVFNYGVASIEPRKPVNDDTLFEIGSVTKTFTATMTSLAHVQHRLSLSDRTERYLPALQGTPFGKVTLLSLGTHTPGGLALQFPDGIDNENALMAYLRGWRPAYAIGTYRTYSNQGIGVLGLITAKVMHEDFRSLMQHRLLPALRLHHTFIAIPKANESDYASGYTNGYTPIRMKAGTLSDETYGIKTTAGDLIRFVRENIDPSDLAPSIRQAVTDTHVGYFRAGPMTQDLIWEQFAHPVTLPALLAGNSRKMLFQATRVTAIAPPQSPATDVWLNKTGSTNGFAAYVAYVPSQKIGVVLLANKNFPISDRVAAAYRILRALRPL